MPLYYGAFLSSPCMSSYSPEYNVVSSISIRALPRFSPRDVSLGPSPYGLHPIPLLQLKSSLFIGSSKNLKDNPRVRAEMRKGWGSLHIFQGTT